ncbi:hypothetical protein RUM44_013102 [Polyplax serrata]|uniref:tRNA (adenine(58)-N(1))-methyltransferase non-catalytic subunit TRM6 n=1 Tax=Polyplax serrata TaxID=468196 RepID=A0ABR1BGW2_POLSC
MGETQEVVREGDYVIIQKQNYTKIHKVKKSIVKLGNIEVDISVIVGQPYWTTYKMEPKANAKRLYELKKSEQAISISDEIIKDVTSGSDNREIFDDGSSQKLSTQEIINLRECGMSAHNIVSHLIENSKTFFNKTEYSQEKYLKKKEQKYYEYITIRKPTLRLISEVLLRQPTKLLGLRMDTLAQLVTKSEVQSGGFCIVYENGCSGLVVAAVLDQLGSNGTLIHIHPGNSDRHTEAVQALNLQESQLNQILSLNIQKLCVSEKSDIISKVLTTNTGDSLTVNNNTSESIHEENILGKRKAEGTCPVGNKIRRINEDTEKAMLILKERKADSLIIVGKEHPSNIFKKLIKYLEISRPFVVYYPLREPLVDMYVELKLRHDIIGLRLTESWLRDYQVLPDRTHPNIRISGSGGYLLSGLYVDNT